MDTKLQWGILGTGLIAGKFAQGVVHSRTGQLAAVGSRSGDKARQFAGEYAGMRAHGGYETLLADPAVQVVYIATPHPMHAEWVIKAAEAGKHILCEKPIGINHPEAMAMVEAAQRHDVFLMEAFVYRCHPQTAKLVDLIREGAVGDVRMIHASLGLRFDYDPENRLFNNALGGGGILDLGCYPISVARLIAGVARGEEFSDPISVSGAGHLGETGVDEWAVATLTFPGDVVAQVSTGILVTPDNAARIYGTEGSITVPSPWSISGFEGGSSTIIVKSHNRDPQEITVKTSQWLYGIEADTVAANIDQRQAPSPAMTWNDTLGNMKALDAWRSEIGLEYDAEKSQNYTHTVHRRPLVVRDASQMKYGQIQGLDKKVSRVVMGTDYNSTMPHTAIMCDDFFERGGNAFDTAYIYLDGQCERLLGHWIHNRGIRDQVTIVAKGAHSPHCHPEAVAEQLQITLDRLQTDYVDVYFLHRDNPDVPVGEFIDVLNEQCRAGRVTIFGGSNWTIQRLDEANAYAARKDMAGFSVLSNNFSLARMVNPPWRGVEAAWGADWREWLTRSKMTLMPWSSQARGFFTDCAGPDKHEDVFLVRGWYSDDNFERRRRAVELANKKGVDPINIALAYVLTQPFATFPVIGPHEVRETRIALRGLNVNLTAQERGWLDLGV